MAASTTPSGSGSSPSPCSSCWGSTCAGRTAGPEHPPFHRRHAPHRRPAHHPHRPEEPFPRALRHPARARTRPVRAGLRPGAPPHPPRRRAVDGAARVAVAALGEPGRPEPALLGVPLPAAAAAFPEALGDVALEDFHRAINRVRRSPIRVEADEVTYNLHIVLRYRLELALLRDELAVKDLPGAWNAEMETLRSGSGPATTSRACFRTSTGPRASSATSPPTRSETSMPRR